MTYGAGREPMIPTPADATACLQAAAGRPGAPRLAESLWPWVGPALTRSSLRRSFGWRRAVLRRFGARLTDRSGLARTAWVTSPAGLTMGAAILADDVVVVSDAGVWIGDETVVSQRVRISTVDASDRWPGGRAAGARPVRIGSGVWVAAGAYIGPGVTVGDNVVVGACAVIVDDVPPGVVVAGDPARIIRPRVMAAAAEGPAAEGPAANAANAAAGGPTTGRPDMPDAARPNPTAPVQALDRCAPAPYTRREYLGRYAWLAVQRTLFRLSPRRAYRWRAMLLRAGGARVGPGTRVSNRCSVMHPWLFELGDSSSVGDDVAVYNLGPVRIGRQSAVSQGTYVCAGTHDYTRPDLPLRRTPITVGDGVWVAAQAFLGPGVTVGDNSVVAARAVVTKDVPPGTVVGGNPARLIKPRVMAAAAADTPAGTPAGPVAAPPAPPGTEPAVR